MKRTTYFLVFLLPIIIFSCSKEKLKNPDFLTSKMQLSQAGADSISVTCDKVELTSTSRDRIQKDFKLLATGLIELTNDNIFKSILLTEVAKKFDGDDNALFKDILAACNLQNYPLETNMHYSIMKHGSQDLKNDVDRLSSILTKITVQSTNFYPQIAVFSPEDSTSLPKIAYFDTNYVEMNHPDLNGYNVSLIADTVFSATAEMVDTGYASSYLTWVVNNNESVNCEGNFTATHSGKSKKSCSITNTKWIEFFDQIKIKTDKSGFWDRKNEVWYEYRAVDDLCMDQTMQYGNYIIKKLDDNKIGTNVSVHVEFFSKWD